MFWSMTFTGIILLDRTQIRKCSLYFIALIINKVGRDRKATSAADGLGLCCNKTELKPQWKMANFPRCRVVVK